MAKLTDGGGLALDVLIRLGSGDDCVGDLCGGVSYVEKPRKGAQTEPWRSSDEAEGANEGEEDNLVHGAFCKGLWIVAFGASVLYRSLQAKAPSKLGVSALGNCCIVRVVAVWFCQPQKFQVERLAFPHYEWQHLSSLTRGNARYFNSAMTLITKCGN